MCPLSGASRDENKVSCLVCFSVRLRYLVFKWLEVKLVLSFDLSTLLYSTLLYRHSYIVVNF